MASGSESFREGESTTVMRPFAASNPTTFCTSWALGACYIAPCQNARNSLARAKGSRRTYHIDLSDLHAQCEANYHRLVRLFPGYEQQPCGAFEVGDAVVELEVTARDRYTTDMRLRYQGSAIQMGSKSCLDLRLYHDARMAEVVHCSTSRRFEARYRYPNPEMLQRDEKFQQNRFAAELMEFCLTNGRSTNAPLTDSDSAGS